MNPILRLYTQDRIHATIPHSSVTVVMIDPRQEHINEVHHRRIEPMVSHLTRQAGVGVHLIEHSQ